MLPEGVAIGFGCTLVDHSMPFESAGVTAAAAIERNGRDHDLS
jgi:hypothetical protein